MSMLGSAAMPASRVATLPGLLLALVLTAPTRATESVVDLPTRPGATLRMLVNAPERPIGSVVLIPGGTGEMDLGSDGQMVNLAGNPAVRTRTLYLEAGFAYGVLDVASDLRTGDGPASYVRQVSSAQIADLGNAIRHMRGIAAPVAVIGFSRGGTTAASAAAVGGPARPDAVVLVSAMWFTTRATPTSVEYVLRRDGEFAQPALLVAHDEDACPFSNPAELARFRPRLGGAHVESLVLHGGGPPRGDRCGPFAFHGHVGMDREAIAAITSWLQALPR
jgi:hypothetical protein